MRFLLMTHSPLLRSAAEMVCGMSNHGHDVTMHARSGAQNAKKTFSALW